MPVGYSIIAIATDVIGKGLLGVHRLTLLMVCLILLAHEQCMGYKRNMLYS